MKNFEALLAQYTEVISTATPLEILSLSNEMMGLIDSYSPSDGK